MASQKVQFLRCAPSLVTAEYAYYARLSATAGTVLLGIVCDTNLNQRHSVPSLIWDFAQIKAIRYAAGRLCERLELELFSLPSKY